MKTGGGTPIGDAMAVARLALDRSGLKRRHLLVVTDGENTDGRRSGAGRVGPREAARRRAGPSLYFVAFDVDADAFAGGQEHRRAAAARPRAAPSWPRPSTSCSATASSSRCRGDRREAADAVIEPPTRGLHHRRHRLRRQPADPRAAAPGLRGAGARPARLGAQAAARLRGGGRQPARPRHVRGRHRAGRHVRPAGRRAAPLAAKAQQFFDIDLVSAQGLDRRGRRRARSITSSTSASRSRRR